MKINGIDIPKHIFDDDPKFWLKEKLEKEINEKYGVEVLCLGDNTACIRISDNINISVYSLDGGFKYSISNRNVIRFVHIPPKDMEKIVKLFPFLKKRYPVKKRIKGNIIKVDFNKKM
jgi:hypothetical protein